MQDREARVIVLMGVSGCGKTTIGELLAERLGWEFRDGDSFHPEENIKKMSAGIPLTDEDRIPWLDAIQAWISVCLADHRPTVLTCSALKEQYRQRLVLSRAAVRPIFLTGELEFIAGRLKGRQDHFMPVSLLQSQFDILEEPSDVVTIDVRSPPAQIVAQILSVIGKTAVPRSPKSKAGTTDRRALG